LSRVYSIQIEKQDSNSFHELIQKDEDGIKAAVYLVECHHIGTDRSSWNL